MEKRCQEWHDVKGKWWRRHSFRYRLVDLHQVSYSSSRYLGSNVSEPKNMHAWLVDSKEKDYGYRYSTSAKIRSVHWQKKFPYTWLRFNLTLKQVNKIETNSIPVTAPRTWPSGKVACIFSAVSLDCILWQTKGCQTRYFLPTPVH